jgi:hypothetical protein
MEEDISFYQFAINLQSLKSFLAIYAAFLFISLKKLVTDFSLQGTTFY